MSYFIINALIYIMFFRATVLLITIRILSISFSSLLCARTLALYLIIAYLYCLNYLILSPISVVLSNSVGSGFVDAIG